MNLLSIAIVLAALAQIDADRPYPSAQGDLFLEDATINPKQGKDIEIPARADGMLTRLPVSEGDRIDAGMTLATIDDREAQAAVDVQVNALEAAEKRAADDIELQYAEASSEVAKVDLKKSHEANARKPNSVTDIEILEKGLVVKRSQLQIDKATKDQELALLDANVKKQELHAAKVALDHRQIKAPFAGDVEKIFVQQYEWVRAGDPIMRLVDFSVLDVACYVRASDYGPAEIDGRPVTVRINLPRDREVSVQGRVVFVSQVVDGHDEFLVRADIPNQRNGRFWLIQPGLEAAITIHVNETAAAASNLDSPSLK